MTFFILALAAIVATLGAGTAAATASPKIRARWRRVAIVAARKLVIYYRTGHRGPRVIARFQQILRVPATGTVDARTEARVFELLGPVIWSDERALDEKTDPKLRAEKRERERQERERKERERKERERKERERKERERKERERQEKVARGPSVPAGTAPGRKVARGPSVPAGTGPGRKVARGPSVPAGTAPRETFQADYQATRYPLATLQARPKPAPASPEEAARVLRTYTVDGGNQGTKTNRSQVVTRAQELMQGVAVDGIVGPETRDRAKALGYVLALRDKQRPGVDDGKYLSLLH